MSIVNLAIHSQAVKNDNETDNLKSTGPLDSGNMFGLYDSASAIRFEFPNDFAGSETINSVILNLNIRRFDSVEEEDAGHTHAVGVLAASSQVLPTTGSGVATASRGSTIKTIGVNGTAVSEPDYTIAAESYNDRQIDLTTVFEEAQTAGRLNGGFVVILIQPIYTEFGANVSARGLGEVGEASLDFDYMESSPPPDPLDITLEETLDNITLQSEVKVQNAVEVNETLDSITLESIGYVPADAELNETLDNITLESTALLTQYIELEETLDNITLDAIVYGTEPIEASLEETLENITLSSEVSVGPRTKNRKRLFADSRLFLSKRSRLFA